MHSLNRFFSLFVITVFIAINTAAQRPNVVIIYADDLGWNQLSSYGNVKAHTPNIDAIGKNGVRFTQAYSTAPICSPSRAGLLTGRYQQRFGAEFLVPELRPTPLKDAALINKIKADEISRRAINEKADTASYNKLVKGIPTDELVIGKLFKQAGYATGAFGKWHVGEAEGLKPWQRGFDEYYGMLTWGSLYSPVNDPDIITRSYHFHTNLSRSTSREGSIEIVRNGEVIEETKYLTDRLAEETISFIDRHKDSSFFLYVPFNSVHDPFQAKKSDFDKVTTSTDTTERIYIAMLESLDQAVGRIVAKLREDHLLDNTLLFFGSDNGGASYTGQMTNAPLKAGKLSHFEGGVRVPLVFQYPAKVKGDIIFDKPVSNLDIFATAVAAASIKLPTNKKYDGVDLVPFIIQKNNKDPHQSLYWRNGYSKAIRKGNYKLYINEKNSKILLYDLSNDISEKTDLSAKFPQKVKELKQDLSEWEKTLATPRWPYRRSEHIDELEEDYYFPI